jgi:membrane protein required for colicin V production
MPISMSWVDIALIAALGLSTVVGLMRGFVFELLSLAGWFAAYFLAQGLTPLIQPHIPAGLPGSPLNFGVSFACVFVASLLLWSLCARLVQAVLHATPLSLIDRLLGAGFGLLRGMVVLLVVVTLVNVSPLARAKAWQQSRGAIKLNTLLQELRPLLGKSTFQHPSAP